MGMLWRVKTAPKCKGRLQAGITAVIFAAFVSEKGYGKL